MTSNRPPLRVLYVINGLGTGGAERSLAEMLPQLHAAKIHLTVACLYRRDQGVEESVNAGFDVKFLDSTSIVGRVRELRRLMREVRPDIVHTTLFDSDLVGRLAAIGSGCKVLTSLVNASYGPERLSDPNVAAFKLRAARMVDAITARYLTDRFHAITHAVKDASVQRLGIDPERVSVIERGRDAARLGEPSDERKARARKLFGFAPDAQVLVNVGRQEFQKGHLDLVAAMALLRKSHPEVLLLQAGRRGNASGAIEASIEANGLSPHVQLLGHREDIPDLLAAADVFVFPSLYEGLGGAVLEAMALALPVVATRIPALIEVLEEDGNAMLVPPGSPHELAAALAALLNDHSRRRAYAIRGRRIFAERFQLERSVQRMVLLYQEISGV